MSADFEVRSLSSASGGLLIYPCTASYELSIRHINLLIHRRYAQNCVFWHPGCTLVLCKTGS